jgi:GNAT superfamily N-acetyltransferase
VGKPVALDSAALAVRYADDLARKNSEALSFIPRPMIERYAERGQLMLATENGEPCGFVIHGEGWPQMRIYQACIQYDARRREHGMALVARLADKARARGCTDIRLWCADDLDSNDFWRAAGFEACGSRAGGKRRGRRHVLWALRLTPLPLLALAAEGATGNMRSGAEVGPGTNQVTRAT